MPPFADHPRPPGTPELLDSLTLEVARPMVLLRLGYRRPNQVPARTAELLDAISEQGSDLLAPRAVCLHCPINESSDGGVAIGSVLTTSSRTLAEGVAGCPQAWLFAATLGPAVDDWIAGLSASDEMTRTLLADAWASAAAIQLGLDLESLLGRRLRASGLVPGRRCAPGYGDWDLAAQGPLLRRLEADRIGITLSAAGMMAPLKSVSGLIGGRLENGGTQATAEAPGDPSRF